jgi:hypothetical protein
MSSKASFAGCDSMSLLSGNGVRTAWENGKKLSGSELVDMSAFGTSFVAEHDGVWQSALLSVSSASSVPAPISS